MSGQAVRGGEFGAAAGLGAFVFLDVGVVPLLVLVEVALFCEAIEALGAHVISLTEMDVFLVLGQIALEAEAVWTEITAIRFVRG